MTDKEFYAATYQKYYEPLFKYVMRKVNDYGIAQNLVQDTFLWAWAKIGELREKPYLKKWLFTTAKYAVLKDTRKKYHTEIPLSDLEYTPDISDKEMDLLEILPQGLKAEEIQLLKMRYIDNLGYEDMAAELNTSVYAAKKRSLRAVKRCRELMGDSPEFAIQK